MAYKKPQQRKKEESDNIKDKGITMRKLHSVPDYEGNRDKRQTSGFYPPIDSVMGTLYSLSIAMRTLDSKLNF